MGGPSKCRKVADCWNLSKLGQTVKGAMSRGRELDKGVGEYRQLDRQNISAFSTSLSTSLGLRAGHVQQVKIWLLRYESKLNQLTHINSFILPHLFFLYSNTHAVSDSLLILLFLLFLLLSPVFCYFPIKFPVYITHKDIGNDSNKHFGIIEKNR